MRRKPKRRLSLQNLENRRLFAADIGVSDAPYGPEVPARVGSIRPTKVDRPVFGPVSESCPPCQLEVNGEASEMERHPAPTETPPIVHDPIDTGCPPRDFEVNAIPVSSISLPGISWPIKSISATDAEPKPTKIERPMFGPHFRSSPFISANVGSANVGGTGGPGGTTFLTANIAGCVPNTD